LDARAVAMVVGIVSEMAAVNECNRYCDFMKSGTTDNGLHAAQPYITLAMRKKAAIVMLQEI